MCETTTDQLVGALGIRHQVAIDHVKFMIEENGDDQKDFDYLSFDYLEGNFIEQLFYSAQSIEIWAKADLIGITHLGPVSPDNYPEDNLDADQYTDPNKGKFEAKPTNWLLS